MSALVDRVFERASSLISSLPTRQAKGSWQELVDVSTPSGLITWRDAGLALIDMATDVPQEKAFHLTTWGGHALIGAGEYDRALDILPRPALGARASMVTDHVLSLKCLTGKHVSGADVASLFGPKLTKFGRENIEAIVEFLEIRVSEIQSHEGRNLLEEWTADAHKGEFGLSLFQGHASYIYCPSVPAVHYSYSKSAESMCVALMCDAENTFREERNIPRIGKGWIAETELYYAIKEALAGEEVIQHGRPSWLGRQHLDIYIPGRRVALEYQGVQHDRPVAFFGGEEAYLKNLERDRNKLAKCRQNRVEIIYVREGYVLSDLIATIVDRALIEGR